MTTWNSGEKLLKVKVRGGMKHSSSIFHFIYLNFFIFLGHRGVTAGTKCPFSEFIVRGALAV